MEKEKLRRAGRFVLQGLNQLLWPAVCMNCLEGIGGDDQILCSVCWDSLLESTGADYCPSCGKDTSKFGLVDNKCPDCQGREFHFESIARCGVYMDALRSMILSFKSGQAELALVLNSLANSALVGTVFCESVDMFVAVPLHWKRKLKRGYNQSMLICKKLKQAKGKICTDLVRIRNTRPQTTFDDLKTFEARRAANVAGAFAVRKGNNFSGKNICLVDDIKTTGATLNECAKTLKEAGSAKVYALALAVAGQNT
ncbi:MAG: double zinc ribbon domain-containing protein [Planctomycetota bacterium]|jgi:ComF family protein